MLNGFSRKTIDFLIELRARNDREWYREHKTDYERLVLRPFQALVTALAPTVMSIDPEIEVTPAVGKTISRIFRDTRFSLDKTLYRDRAWLMFERKQGEKVDIPGFFFELTPVGYSYGMGFYYVSAKTMETYRAMIDRDEDGFLHIIAPVTASSAFASSAFASTAASSAASSAVASTTAAPADTLKVDCELHVEGEVYKRSRYSGTRPEVADWYNRKNIYVSSDRRELAEAFDFDTLAARLAAGYIKMAGVYHFWREAAAETASKLAADAAAGTAMR
jgi:uncharacterized protein (TIGR02453 family)